MRSSRRVWPAHTLGKLAQPILVSSTPTRVGIISRRGYSRYRMKKREFDPARAPRIPIFEIPPAILDLEAEDSPYVRPESQRDLEEQDVSWNQNPDFDALAERMAAFRRDLEHKDWLWNKRLGTFDARRITERDIVQVAFLGSPKGDANPPSETNEERSEAPGTSDAVGQQAAGDELLTRNTLKSIGLSDRVIDDERHILPILFRRLQVQSDQDKAADAVSQESLLDMFKQTIQNQDLVVQRRIIAPLLKTQEGARLVGMVMPELQKAFDERRQDFDQPTSLQEATVLRSIAINLGSRGIEVSASKPRSGSRKSVSS
ncbi:hypothetical protein GQ53DRAFT_157501 [Thozetella sp. PMI_491]|nr:hypothetical protein GQ53DRAFT_157501 [Thozetella sp. PMI_491]